MGSDGMVDSVDEFADAGTSKADVSALNRIRGKFKVRSMANTWRQRANNRALPSLTPFIPYLLRDELLEVAKWCTFPPNCARRYPLQEDLEVQKSHYLFRYTSTEPTTGASFPSHRVLYEGKKALVPSIVECRGAVMVADITGFTQLTEVLSKQGSTGVELLINCINSYFGKVLVSCTAQDAPVMYNLVWTLVHLAGHRSRAFSRRGCDQVCRRRNDYCVLPITRRTKFV